MKFQKNRSEHASTQAPSRNIHLLETLQFSFGNRMLTLTSFEPQALSMAITYLQPQALSVVITYVFINVELTRLNEYELDGVWVCKIGPYDNRL